MTESEYRKHECKVCGEHIKKKDNLGLCVSCNYKYNFLKIASKPLIFSNKHIYYMKKLSFKWIIDRMNNHWEETVRVIINY